MHDILKGTSVININGISISDSLSDVINFAELKTLHNLWIKKYNDALYFGQVNHVTLKWEGKGIMHYKNGRVYEGFFFNDMWEGKGFEKY